jgi:DNA-binding NarL/FixJ family response regulator
MAFTIHDSPATRLAVTQAKMDGLISKGLSLSKIVEEIERRYSKRNYLKNKKKE